MTDHYQELRGWHPSVQSDLKRILFNDDPAKKERIYKLLNHPLFTPKYGLSLNDQRELEYKRIKMVAEAKIFSIYDFKNDPKNLFTCHELIALFSGSMAIKFTVQFNLFGGTLMALATERHKPFMDRVDSLENMGCFCFTELGYGNNAVKMETTAIYDNHTQEFIINSPTTLSHKYWITNGACHAN